MLINSEIMTFNFTPIPIGVPPPIQSGFTWGIQEIRVLTLSIAVIILFAINVRVMIALKR